MNNKSNTLQNALKIDVESGQYFLHAQNWYKYRYITPIVHRTLFLNINAIIFIILLGLVININDLMPSTQQVKYLLNDGDFIDKRVEITKANQIDGNSLLSIADILIKNYVIKREEYKYTALKQQFIFVKNTSTRLEFKKFYNLMSLDNTLSPVRKYKKDIYREIKIITTTYNNHNHSMVKFKTIAKNAQNKVTEELLWQADLEYEIDSINIAQPSGARFNFVVTEYKLTLLTPNNTKK